MSRVTDVPKKLILLGVLFLLVMLGRWMGISCILLYLTGIPCPGCGMTRACLAALRFDFAAAFSYHPMVWSVPFLLAYFFCEGNLFRQKRINRMVLIWIGVGFLLNWLMQLYEILL